LLVYRPVDLHDLVSVEIAPEAGEPIDETLSACVDKFKGLGAFNKPPGLIALSEPKLHRSKGMPEILGVHVGNFLGRHIKQVPDSGCHASGVKPLSSSIHHFSFSIPSP
jgi:hypothetical protein